LGERETKKTIAGKIGSIGQQNKSAAQQFCRSTRRERRSNFRSAKYLSCVEPQRF
jgi:hypothetical protein